MRAATSFVLLCAVAALGLISGATPVAAETPALINDNASECDIAGALGIGKPSCPGPVVPSVATPNPPTPLGSRGLRMGNLTQMTEMPPVPGPAQPQTTTATPAKPHAYAAAFQINFAFGTATLTDDARRMLDRIGSVLTSPGTESATFRITGHTDGIGSPSRNLRLSAARAEAVKEYFIRTYRIDPSRLQAVGRGASALLNPDNPAAPENRRVEITHLTN